MAGEREGRGRGRENARKARGRGEQRTGRREGAESWVPWWAVAGLVRGPSTRECVMEEQDLKFLRRCVELAREAVDHGDEAFGSLLVNADGEILVEDRNRIAGGDSTQHPEFNIARWAAANMTPEERAGATVYTSGEHCPMCSAAHAWVGLGPIVFAAGSDQFAGWLRAWGLPDSPVNTLRVNEVAPGIATRGPALELAAEIQALHARAFGVA